MNVITKQNENGEWGVWSSTGYGRQLIHIANVELISLRDADFYSNLVRGEVIAAYGVEVIIDHIDKVCVPKHLSVHYRQGHYIYPQCDETLRNKAGEFRDELGHRVTRADIVTLGRDVRIKNGHFTSS